MTEPNARPQPAYRPGDVVNGYVFTGVTWVKAAPVRPGMATSTKLVLLVLGLVGGMVGLGVVAAIAIPVYLNSRAGQWETVLQDDLRHAAAAADTHWSMTGAPPVDAQVLDDYGWSPAPGVSIMLAPGGPDGYCVAGMHDDLPGQVWHYAPTSGLAVGPCP